MRTAGGRLGCLLADAGYGMSAQFRQALSELGLSWALGIPGRQKAYPADVAMIFPAAGHGRPRQHHIPDSKSVAAETLLAGKRWQRVSWRRGTKRRLTARFAALRVRAADGLTQRISPYEAAIPSHPRQSAQRDVAPIRRRATPAAMTADAART